MVANNFWEALAFCLRRCCTVALFIMYGKEVALRRGFIRLLLVAWVAKKGSPIPRCCMPLLFRARSGRCLGLGSEHMPIQPGKENMGPNLYAHRGVAKRNSAPFRKPRQRRKMLKIQRKWRRGGGREVLSGKLRRRGFD